MRPELVLDANGKQERFKKYLRKKNEERMKAEELSNELGETTKPMPPLQPIPGVGYPLNVLLQQMQPFYPEPQTSFPSHVSPPQLPLPFRFPMSGTKQVDSSRISSPPPESPRPVDLTSHPLNRTSVTSPSISSQVKYMPSYEEATKSREQMEEFAKSAQLPALTKLHRSSVIANPGPVKKVYDEGSDVVERESSSERDEASSSKRRYWPLHPLLENSLPLHVEIKVEPEQEQEQEPVTEESLLHKYCHKKFQKAKTFSSDLRPPADITEGENRKRRSVIVQAPSSKKPCSQDLRSFRISKPNPVEEAEQQEQKRDFVEESKVVTAGSSQQEQEKEKEGFPVDLSRSSPTFQQGSWPSPRQQSTEHLSDQEVPTFQ